MSQGAVADAIQRQDVSGQQYLEERVAPILLQGLEALCRDRPYNPVDYLAMFLLKRNPMQNITVEVPMSATVPAEPGTPAP